MDELSLSELRLQLELNEQVSRRRVDASAKDCAQPLKDCALCPGDGRAASQDGGHGGRERPAEHRGAGTAAAGQGVGHGHRDGQAEEAVGRQKLGDPHAERGAGPGREEQVQSRRPAESIARGRIHLGSQSTLVDLYLIGILLDDCDD